MRAFLILLLASVSMWCTGQMFLPHRHAVVAPISTSNPPYFTNLLVWVSASTFDGTLANGRFVTNWPDLSGNNNFFTKTTTNSPTYASNQINGLSALVFNCTNTECFDSTASGSATVTGWWNQYTNYHAFAVLKSAPFCETGFGNGLWGFTYVEPLLGRVRQELYPRIGGSVRSRFMSKGDGSTESYVIGNLTTTAWAIVDIGSMTNNYSYYFNNSLQFNTTNNVVGTPVNGTYAALGASFFYNSVTSATDYYSGWIAELLIYKGDLLTDQSRTNVYFWLKSKYNL